MLIILLFLIVILMFPKEIYAQTYNQVKVSWYTRGLKNPERFTTACWNEFPKGTKFKVTYRDNVVIVVCNDRGHFRELRRFLDLSSGAFSQLVPLSRGIIKVNVEIVK